MRDLALMLSQYSFARLVEIISNFVNIERSQISSAVTKVGLLETMQFYQQRAKPN